MMDKLIFKYKDKSGQEDEYNQTVTVSYNVPEGMSIYTLHRLCKKFALTMGYADASVESVFGETQWND